VIQHPKMPNPHQIQIPTLVNCSFILLKSVRLFQLPGSEEVRIIQKQNILSTAFLHPHLIITPEKLNQLIDYSAVLPAALPVLCNEEVRILQTYSRTSTTF
jgi:hypothetical protein